MANVQILYGLGNVANAPPNERSLPGLRGLGVLQGNVCLPVVNVCLNKKWALAAGVVGVWWFWTFWRGMERERRAVEKYR